MQYSSKPECYTAAPDPPDHLPKPKTTIEGDIKTVVSYELVEGEDDDDDNSKRKIKKVRV